MTQGFLEWIESLPTLGSGVIVVGGFVLLTFVVGTLVARFAPAEVRREHNDLAGFILAVIGVVYAVLLAFVAIGVWERFQHAESRSWEEAAALTLLYRDAESFRDAAPLRAELRAYAAEVAEREFPQMRRGASSELAARQIEQIDKEVRALNVRTMAEQNIHAQMLAAVDDALGARVERLAEQSTGINPLMWAILTLGAVLTVGFTYLFGFRHSIMQHLMIGSLGLVIGLVLFLAVALDYPYRGSIAVPPESFRTALENFNLIGP